MSVSETFTPAAYQGEYKVVIKKGGGFSAFDTCRLSISVGQPYHEGAKLRATFEWAAKRFPQIIVSVNDTLQRYNMIDGQYDMAVAHANARHKGDAWLARNSDALKLMNNPEIQRWDQWLAHPDYTTTRHMVDGIYKRHEGFKADIDGMAQKWAERHGADAKLSRLYLLEETAVFALQQAASIAVDVYPGSVMSIWERFRTENIEGAPQSLSNRLFTRIDFARVKVA